MELDEKIECAQAQYSNVPDDVVENLYKDLDKGRHFERNTLKTDLVERALEYGDRAREEDSQRATGKSYSRQILEGEYKRELYNEFDRRMDRREVIDRSEIDEVVDMVFNYH